jgi:hypothetical protein
MRPKPAGYGTNPTLTIEGVNFDTSSLTFRAWSKDVNTGAKISLVSGVAGVVEGNDVSLVLALGATGLAIGQVIDIRAEDSAGNQWVPNGKKPDRLLLELVERFAD